MATERMSRNGLTVQDLVERTGVSRTNIVQWTAEPREEYLSRAQQRHEQIRRLRAEGLSMRAIAARVGCTVGTVHYALTRAATASKKDIA